MSEKGNCPSAVAMLSKDLKFVSLSITFILLLFLLIIIAGRDMSTVIFGHP